MAKRRKKRKYGKKIFALAIIFLFLLLIAGILLSPVLEIEKIIVYGNKEIDSEEIKTNINSMNILLLTTAGLEKDLLKKIPKIAQVEIRKNIFKKTLNISVVERENVGIACKEETNNCFYIDKNGAIFEDAPKTSGSLIILIKDFSSQEFFIGKKILSEQIVASIIEIKENLDYSTNIKVNWFEIHTDPPKELKVIIYGNWYILFDSTKEIEKQLSVLKTALDEKIKTTENLEYIDLRIENRIYYK